MLKKEIRELNGYRLVLMPEHPRAMTCYNWRGYVYEHIVVAEESINRQLQPNEVVHHLDGRRGNNRKENLLVLSVGEHAKLHVWLEKAGTGKERETVEYCLVCGKTLQEKEIRYCSSECSSFGARRVARPNRETLKKDLESMSYLAVGRKYGVSDNAIRKWERAYETGRNAKVGE